MTLLELLTEWRRRVDDVSAPFLWSKADGISYLNQAEREAAERAKLILDTTTKAVCDINGKANVGTYPLHPKILEIESCTWQGRFLDGKSRSQLDEGRIYSGYRKYGWEASGVAVDWRTLKGTPYFYLDPQERFLTLVRIPEVAAPIHLTAYRLPLEDMVNDTDEPELVERHHFNLVDWMCALSFLKQDTETYNPQAATEAEARFTANFGVKVSANTRRLQRERRSNQIRMNPSW